jgi:hypothetical protein
MTTQSPSTIASDLTDPMYLLAAIEHCAVLAARGELNDRQRQWWSECRAALLRMARNGADDAR